MRPWLEQLRAVPFVMAARLAVPAAPARAGRRPVEGEVVLRTAGGDHRLRLEDRRTFLTVATAEQAVRRMKAAAPNEPWLLAAPFVGPEVGARLMAGKINYVDDVGNCHITLGPGYVAHIQGKRPMARMARDRGTHAQGYLVMLALLARPELVAAPVRGVAAAAGVGKTTAAHMLAKLEEEGVVGGRGERRRILDAKRLMDRWVVAYETVVRPHLLVGRYRGPDKTPGDAETRIERAMPVGAAWGWSGGAAAMRLTSFYRGPDVVFHVAEPPPDLDRVLGILRARDGDIVILRARGEVMLAGVRPRTVHPLLVYTELMTQGDQRAREAAEVLAERFLRGGVK